MEPLVSILIPAYNAAAWIRDTIDSALAQTWPNKEIIVVDDGSHDGTLAIAKKYERCGVKVFSQSNAGAAAARNKAFSLCHGEYIQWLDADDLLAPNKISKQMQGLNKCRDKRTLLSSAWGVFIYRTRKAKFRPTSLWCDLSPVEWLSRQMGENLFMQPSAWLVSRELTEAAGPWDTRLSFNDDGEYFGRVVLASDEVKFVPEAESYYRRLGGASLSNIGSSGKKLESLFLSLKLLIGHLTAVEDSDRTRAASVKFLQELLVFFYPERLDLVEQAKTLAASLGGGLEIPQMSWKYSWLQKVLGWDSAKLIQQRYNISKAALMRSWDRALFLLEKSSIAQKRV